MRRLPTRLSHLLAGVWLAMISIICSAAPQDLGALQSLVSQYLYNQLQGKPGKIRIEVQPLDKRIVLEKCAKPELTLPAGARLAGRTTVNVRCLSPAKWSINFQALISIQTEVVVANRPLPQGKTLEPDDISMVTRELSDLPASTLTTPEQALGRMLISAIPAGNVLRNENFRAAFAVLQNQAVRVIAASNEFRIETQGKALGNALAGQVVNVKMQSGQVVQGIAQAGGIVQIDVQ